MHLKSFWTIKLAHDQNMNPLLSPNWGFNHKILVSRDVFGNPGGCRQGCFRHRTLVTEHFSRVLSVLYFIPLKTVILTYHILYIYLAYSSVSMYPTNHPHFRQVKELAAFQLNRQISDEKFDLCINIEHGIAFAWPQPVPDARLCGLNCKSTQQPAVAIICHVLDNVLTTRMNQEWQWWCQLANTKCHVLDNLLHQVAPQPHTPISPSGANTGGRASWGWKRRLIVTLGRVVFWNIVYRPLLYLLSILISCIWFLRKIYFCTLSVLFCFW